MVVLLIFSTSTVLTSNDPLGGLQYYRTIGAMPLQERLRSIPATSSLAIMQTAPV